MSRGTNKIYNKTQKKFGSKEDKLAVLIHRTMNEQEVFKQVCNDMALKMAKNFLEAFEISGKVTGDRLELIKREVREFEEKIDKENEVYKGGGSFSIETTDTKGRITDSGGEQPMKITERATKALEKIADKAEAEELEETLLDVVDTSRSPKVQHTYDFLSEEKKKEPSTADLLEMVSHEKGITSEGQKAEDINEYGSAEARWNRRVQELKVAGKPKANTDDENEVLAAVKK